MTVAQMRAGEVRRLARYHRADFSEDDVREARRLMNSFYRLCALAERNLYLANDERTVNLSSTKASEDREHRWYKRLSAEFMAFAGLELAYCGYMPSIGLQLSTGGFSERITRYFYN